MRLFKKFVEIYNRLFLSCSRGALLGQLSASILHRFNGLYVPFCSQSYSFIRPFVLLCADSSSFNHRTVLNETWHSVSPDTRSSNLFLNILSRLVSSNSIVYVAAVHVGLVYYFFFHFFVCQIVP